MPITVKAVLVTLLVGTLLGLIWDQIHAKRMREIFQERFREDLVQRARQQRVRLDQYVKNHHQSANLLIAQKKFHDYLARRKWDAEGIRFYQRPPPWYPPRGIQRAFIQARHSLLLDKEGNVREVYTRGSGELPAPVLGNTSPMLRQLSENQSFITRLQGNLHLITNQPLYEVDPPVILMLITPMDDSFLVASQGLTQESDMVALMDAGSGRILASSNHEEAPPGITLDSLSDRYLWAKASYFDYGNSDVVLQLVSLAPVSQLQSPIERVVERERLMLAAATATFILTFMMVLLRITRRIQRITQRMVTFSREELGFDPHAAGHGDELREMRDSFRRMAEEISRARANELIKNQKLEETNIALRDSLTMVKRTHAKLIESEKMAALGSLVAGIAHEINTPVGVGFTAASHLQEETRHLQERFALNQLTRGDLEEFIATANEAADLIQGNLKSAANLIRSFKQVSTDQASREWREMNLHQHLHQVMASLSPQFRNTRIGHNIQCDPALVIHSHPGALSRILTNLVINALVHAYENRPQGEITLQARRKDGMIEIDFVDDGLGMPESVRSRLFEPFFTTKPGQGGSGLGMHMVYSLVTKTLKGTIDCHSLPEQGTTFHLRFPDRAKDAA